MATKTVELTEIEIIVIERGLDMYFDSIERKEKKFRGSESADTESGREQVATWREAKDVVRSVYDALRKGKAS